MSVAGWCGIYVLATHHPAATNTTTSALERPQFDSAELTCGRFLLSIGSAVVLRNPQHFRERGENVTQQYTQEGYDDQDPGTSEEAGAVQAEAEQQPQQQPTEDTESFLRRVVRSELSYLDRRVQSLDSRMTNWQTEQMNRIVALAAQGEDTRGMLSDLHEVTIDPSERDRKALERRLSRAEAQQSQPQPQVQQQPDGRLSEAQFEEVFRGENGIIDSLREWGATHGIPAADFNAAWDMLNTNAAGAGVEYTTAGLRKYEAAMKREITKYAQARYNAQKPQTRTQPVRAQGAPARNWDAVQKNAKDLNSFSDADYEAYLKGK